MSQKQIVRNLCKSLRLGSNISEQYPTIETESHEDFLIQLLNSELAYREVERRNRYLKQAGFEVMKSLEDFSFHDVVLPEKLSLEEVKSESFIDRKENLILYGKPGTGKTHLATALGVKACSQGKQVRFFKTSKLVNLLCEAQAKNVLNKFLKQLEKIDLLILDEWGYIPFERVGTQLLFQAVSDCYERRSVILTTNLPFNDWNTIFYDEKLTNAMLDRLVHHGYLIIHDGPSYRLTHSQMQ